MAAEGSSRRPPEAADRAAPGTRPAAWLLKTEPSTYAFDDLVREKKAVWDGVTNPVALRNIREMRAGDRAVIYHTGAEKSAVGFARVTRGAYPDPKRGDERLVVVDLEPAGRLPRPVALAELKSHAAFADSPLVRQGRLSVVPLTWTQLTALETLARKKV
jgi:predicted RNA-binding protein with PUA-like domain